jgi:UDPglucose 6-dehydrogenase
MGLDGRISSKFLHPGLGYGGSCFPKDTEALYQFASTCGYEFKLLKGVISANKRQRELMVGKIKRHLIDLKGKTIAILGLAFKQNTDDIRKSPSINIIKLLLKEDANIRCFDPLAMDNTKKILPSLTYCQDEYETAEHRDALVIATEWNQFRNLNLLKIKKLLKSPILLDLRNLYDPATLKSLGFIYEGVGRK